MTNKAWLLGVALLLAGCDAKRFTAHINDGDVVRLVGAPRGHEWIVEKGGERARLRLVGVYAFDPRTPETSLQERAAEAQAFAEALRGQELSIMLERREPDQRGRYLAFVAQGGRDLGAELVRSGLAAVYTEFPFSREAIYQEADAAARAAQLGLWRDPLATERLRALRKTWAAVRERFVGRPVHDPFVSAEVTP